MFILPISFGFLCINYPLMYASDNSALNKNEFNIDKLKRGLDDIHIPSSIVGLSIDDERKNASFNDSLISALERKNYEDLLRLRETYKSNLYIPNILTLLEKLKENEKLLKENITCIRGYKDILFHIYFDLIVVIKSLESIFNDLQACSSRFNSVEFFLQEYILNSNRDVFESLSQQVLSCYIKSKALLDSAKNMKISLTSSFNFFYMTTWAPKTKYYKMYLEGIIYSRQKYDPQRIFLFHTSTVIEHASKEYICKSDSEISTSYSLIWLKCFGEFLKNRIANNFNIFETIFTGLKLGDILQETTNTCKKNDEILRGSIYFENIQDSSNIKELLLFLLEKPEEFHKMLKDHNSMLKIKADKAKDTMKQITTYLYMKLEPKLKKAVEAFKIEILNGRKRPSNIKEEAKKPFKSTYDLFSLQIKNFYTCRQHYLDSLSIRNSYFSELRQLIIDSILSRQDIPPNLKTKYDEIISTLDLQSLAVKKELEIYYLGLDYSNSEISSFFDPITEFNVMILELKNDFNEVIDFSKKFERNTSSKKND